MYQSFCPFVGIGSPHSLARQRVWLPPGPAGGDTHGLAGKGMGGSNSDEGAETLVLYVYYNHLTTTSWFNVDDTFLYFTSVTLSSYKSGGANTISLRFADLTGGGGSNIHP